MECISNNASLGGEDKRRGVELKGRRVNYRVVAEDKALCIVKESRYLATFCRLKFFFS